MPRTAPHADWPSHLFLLAWVVNVALIISVSNTFILTVLVLVQALLLILHGTGLKTGPRLWGVAHSEEKLPV